MVVLGKMDDCEVKQKAEHDIESMKQHVDDGADADYWLPSGLKAIELQVTSAVLLPFLPPSQPTF